MDKTLEMPQWLLDDNAKRSQGYARDVGDEVFLRSLNDHLKNETPEFSDEIKHPIIFFFGVPRCGKTFFSQLFNHYFDVGYPDNLIARFWRAPYFGIRLSQLLKSKFDAGSDFQSDFGKTKNLFDPHDFAYFWHEHLLKDSHPYDFEAKRDYIHWEKLKKSMAVFSQTFDKPCLFKGVNPSYHMHLIAEHIPQAVFIYLERDLIDAGVSLARARMKNYDDLNHWYGQNPSPKVYHEIKNLSWADQIAHQFQWLTEHYEKELSQMDERRYFRVNYKDFCSDPMLFFTALQARLQEDFGLAMKVSGEVSIEMLVYSSHTEQTTYYTELAQAFERIQLPHRLT
ncbi:MAG: sulfotransferase [Bacteroidota bacterium]